jgi:uncharacterized protein (DUF924 family)
MEPDDVLQFWFPDLSTADHATLASQFEWWFARFGRHPHRNAVLGRESTPGELEYLAQGQLVHTRAVPR